MLQYAMEMERCLYELQDDVMNLEQLSLDEFVGKAEGLCGSEMEGHVLGMIKQGIAAYSNQRNVLKYAHLLDKLLRTPTFRLLLQSVLADLYADIFVALLRQRCAKELAELKILRKYWLGCVDPTVLAHMRLLVLAATNTDLDTGFHPETAAKIKSYYKLKFKLTQEQIALHFPPSSAPASSTFPPLQQSNTTNPPLYSSPFQSNSHLNVKRANQYQLYPKETYFPNQEYPGHRGISKDYLYTRNSVQDNLLHKNTRYEVEMQRYNNEQYESYRGESDGYQPNRKDSQIVWTAQVQEYEHYQRNQKGEQLCSFRKDVQKRWLQGQQEELGIPRKRMLSQETRLTAKDEQEGKGRKIESMLRKLRDLQGQSCKECGQSLATRGESHSKEHVKERLNKVEKRKCRRGVMMSVGEWEGLPSVSVGEYCISLSVNSYELYQCILCREPFLPLFRNNQWLLTNAARTSPSHSPSLTFIHRTCLDALTR